MFNFNIEISLRCKNTGDDSENTNANVDKQSKKDDREHDGKGRKKKRIAGKNNSNNNSNNSCVTTRQMKRRNSGSRPTVSNSSACKRQLNTNMLLTRQQTNEKDCSPSKSLRLQSESPSIKLSSTRLSCLSSDDEDDRCSEMTFGDDDVLETVNKRKLTDAFKCSQAKLIRTGSMADPSCNVSGEHLGAHFKEGPASTVQPSVSANTAVNNKDKSAEVHSSSTVDREQHKPDSPETLGVRMKRLHETMKSCNSWRTPFSNIIPPSPSSIENITKNYRKFTDGGIDSATVFLTKNAVVECTRIPSEIVVQMMTRNSCKLSAVRTGGRSVQDDNTSDGDSELFFTPDEVVDRVHESHSRQLIDADDAGENVW